MSQIMKNKREKKLGTHHLFDDFDIHAKLLRELRLNNTISSIWSEKDRSVPFVTVLKVIFNVRK